MTEPPPTVRDARPEEFAAVMNVLDGAVLEVDAGTVRERIPGGVLVAVQDDRVLGACVIDPPTTGANETTNDGRAASAHVDAIAVRPGRRGQGIGAALVEDAADRWGTLSADFDARNRPFYESLDFGVEPIGGGRFRGVRPRDGGDDAGNATARDRR